MKINKKEYIKPLIIFTTIIITITIIITSIILKNQYQTYIKNINIQIAGIVQKIINENPEKEVEIINELKNINNEDYLKGIQLIEKYGINSSSELFIKQIDKQIKINIRINCIIIFIEAILILIIFICYLIMRDKKLKDIIKYLKQIQNGDYTLQIEENTEGELSDLKNEIYKVTVMLKEQEAILKEDKKYLSNAMSDISHQLKTPLTSISLMVDILQDNPQMEESKRKEFVQDISRQLNQINWLVISLLKLSKLDAGTVEFKKENLNIKEILNEIKQNLSIWTEIKNQQIIISGKEAKILGDKNWTIESIENIIKNCLEYSKENGKVYITYEENNLYTEIIIKDSGKGITQKDLPHIFERFYKGKNSNKNSIGIGLALSKSIIEKQNGTINVKSKIDEGTTFEIKFFKGII